MSSRVGRMGTAFRVVERDTVMTARLEKKGNLSLMWI